MAASALQELMLKAIDDAVGRRDPTRAPDAAETEPTPASDTSPG
jgi:hypothetical protein